MITKYFVNPARDKQYDEALHKHLEATWQLPGRTHSQIARELGAGDAKNDNAYAQAIIWALTAMEVEDDSTVMWYPNLRLPNAVLAAKIAKNKFSQHDVKLYKFAPYRKLIDRNPDQIDAIVQGVIKGYLTKHGARSGRTIYQALEVKLGHITRPVVARALAQLVEDGVLIPKKVPKNNANVYHLALKSVVS